MKKRYTKKYTIINADDFGLCHGTNQAIIDAYTKGVLTSTSILVTCPGFSEAVRLIKKYPRLGIGVHLSLTLGTPIISPKKISLLVDKNNIFYGSFTRLFAVRGVNALHQIEQEFSAQIEKALKAKLPIDHLNSQAHVHMIPHIFPIVVKLAKKYTIPWIRVSKDKFIWTNNIKQNIFPVINHNLIKLGLLNSLSFIDSKFIYKEIKSTQEFYGIYQTGYMSKQVLKSTFAHIQPGITEVLSHPGYAINDSNFDYRPQRMYDFMVSPLRKQELSALIDPEVKQYVKEYDIIGITFKKATTV